MCALPYVFSLASLHGRSIPCVVHAGQAVLTCCPHHVTNLLLMRVRHVLRVVQVVEQQRELVDAASRCGGDLRAAAAAALQHSAEAVQQLRRYFEGQARLVPLVLYEVAAQGSIHAL